MKRLMLNDSILEYRDTPWDKRVFNIDTKEILSIVNKSNTDTSFLINELEAQIVDDGLIYVRIDSNDIELKKIFLANNYYISEASLQLVHSKIQKYDFNKVFRSNMVLDNTIKSTDIKQLKHIACTSFNDGRFHEDPFLRVLANKRYENWIDDLILQKKEILMYRNNDGEILSFMFYEILNSKKANLLLGGSEKSFGLLTPVFFSSVMMYLKKRGIKTVDVVVSMSNSVIINIYVSLGFLVKKTMFDYHKIIKRR